MTAFISRLPDGLRHLVWLVWFPFVYLDLWFKFRDSRNFDSLVWVCWDLGWRGMK